MLFEDQGGVKKTKQQATCRFDTRLEALENALMFIEDTRQQHTLGVVKGLIKRKLNTLKKDGKLVLCEGCWYKSLCQVCESEGTKGDRFVRYVRGERCNNCVRPSELYDSALGCEACAKAVDDIPYWTIKRAQERQTQLYEAALEALADAKEAGRVNAEGDKAAGDDDLVIVKSLLSGSIGPQQFDNLVAAFMSLRVHYISWKYNGQRRGVEENCVFWKTLKPDGVLADGMTVYAVSNGVVTAFGDVERWHGIDMESVEYGTYDEGQGRKHTGFWPLTTPAQAFFAIVDLMFRDPHGGDVSLHVSLPKTQEDKSAELDAILRTRRQLDEESKKKKRRDGEIDSKRFEALVGEYSS